MLLPKLYTLDSKSKTRFWQAEVVDDAYRVLSGLINGSPVVGAWVRCIAKNEGRKNATSAEDQALKEAWALHDKKLKGKYHASLDAVGGHKYFAPMLATTWKSWEALGLEDGEPVYSQPKLNGVRCIAKADGLWSRTGERITTAPHIEAALAPFFEGDPEYIFDGELYNHDFRDDLGTFNGIVSRKTCKTPEEEAQRLLIQYHIYDAPSIPGGFGGRLFFPTDVYNDIPGVHAVPTAEVFDPEYLDTLRKVYLREGYEGQIIRRDAPYEAGKRSKALIKRKEWEDQEFPLVELKPGLGAWADAAKIAVLRLPDGRTFEAGVKGDMRFCHCLLYGPKPVQATIKYFALSPDGIPLHGVAIAFHSEQRL